MRATALFDFEPQTSEELGFIEGQVLDIVKADPHKKWWLATNNAGHSGYVPVNFFRLGVVVNFPAPAPESEEDTTRRGDGETEPSREPRSPVPVHDQTQDATVYDNAAGFEEREDTLYSSEYIEQLLHKKLIDKVISQDEYDQIMEIRRRADSIEATDLNESQDSSAAPMLSWNASNDNPATDSAAAAGPASPANDSKSLGIFQKGKKKGKGKGKKLQIEVQHPWVVGEAEADADADTNAHPRRGSAPAVVGSGARSPVTPMKRDEVKKRLTGGGGGGGRAPSPVLEATSGGGGGGRAPSPVLEATSPGPVSELSVPDGSADGGPGSDTTPNPTARARRSDTPADTHHSKRTMVMHEILETERTYVRILKMVIDVFILPLRKGAINHKLNPTFNILPTQTVEFAKDGSPRVAIEQSQVKIMFHELESIHAINQLLLEQLENRCSKWANKTTIGDVFLSIMSFLRGYTGFANNFENALKTISICKQQASFSNYLAHCVSQKPECMKMWLEDHLISPIQRIPRYIMLLSDLLKHTGVSHPDFELLSQCVVAMKTIARHINDTKKKSERSLKMIAVQRSVKRCPAIITPARIFVCELECIELRPANAEEAAKAKKIVDGGLEGESPTALAPDTSGDGDDDTLPALQRRTSYVGGSVKMRLPHARPRTSDSLALGTGLEPSAKAAARRRRRSLPLTPAERTNPKKAATYSVRLPKGSEAAAELAKRIPKEGDKIEFLPQNEVALYLFNDSLLVAKHEKVDDFLGKAWENTKLSLKGKDAVNRPVTEDDDGFEVLHKYKFVRMEFLDVVTLSEYPGSVANFVIHWPDGPRYYKCRDRSAHPMFKPSGPDEFVSLFANTSREMNMHLEEQMRALHERYGESPI